MSNYSDNAQAATEAAHSYLRDVGIDATSDDYRDRNDYDDRMKAFLAGVAWALNDLPATEAS